MGRRDGRRRAGTGADVTINWDLFAVALTAGGDVRVVTRQTDWFGILLGLGTAAKFYPFLLLGPLLILCIRAGKLCVFSIDAGGAVGRVGWR